MQHESMVHALDEIRRTLKPNGLLIDLRPVEANWLVEVVSSAGWQAAGRLSDLPVALEDDEAAFQAMREQFMDEEWEDFEKMEEHVYQKAGSMWASANADARLRVRVNMLITLWEKRWVAS
jgi:hypothetical protein